MATIRLPLLLRNAQPEGNSFPERGQVSGNNLRPDFLAFDAAVEEKCSFSFRAAGYGSGNLTLKVIWYTPTATFGAVVFGAQLAALTPNTDTQSVVTKALAAVQSVTDTHLGTTRTRVHEIDLPISNLDTLVSGDWCVLTFSRISGAVGDTIVGDIRVLGLELSYSDT